MKSLLLIPAFAVIAALTGCDDQPKPVTTSPSSSPATVPSSPSTSPDPMTNPPASGTTSIVK